MYISSISIKNFRLLQNTKLNVNNSRKQDLSLLIGKNNSGKTSFIVLFDKFFRNENFKFNFNDFSLPLRKDILNKIVDADLSLCSIQMKLEIVYTKADNLENLSDFILDLNPDEDIVRLLFECEIDSVKLESDLAIIDDRHKNKFIEKNLEHYLINNYYVYNNEDDLIKENRDRLIQKSISDIRKVINYQVIHAKRNVSSSEFSGNGKTALSQLTTDYFNKENSFSQVNFAKINDTILEIDETLNIAYEQHFKDYFENVKHFVDGKLNVVSNLESKQILSNYSKVVYGNVDNFLPETLNGLGHLNILFLLLQIEIKKKFFEQEKRDINLLFIEEPEAHTHPQMQYVFAQKIKDILKEISNVQAFITSHSSHIVSQCDFEDLRYFKISDGNVNIKNFHEELLEKYKSEPEHFKFLKQYLTLYSSELFFAEKIIFIEGVSEKLLLPYFIKQYDELRRSEENYIPLTSQNISYIEAGANAKVFRHFIEFLDISTLIITDIDGTEYNTENSRWKACPTESATNTSNESIKYYLNAPNRETDVKKYNNWLTDLKSNKCKSISNKIKVNYQIHENSYQARSFEDAFFSINLELLCENKDNLLGLKNIGKLINTEKNYYNLVDNILEKKSDFSSSVLYIAFTKNIKWNTPTYIIDGLNWISK